MLPALRGLFFLVDMLQTLSGIFSVVDMLPGSPLSGHLPFVAFCLSLLLSLSLVVFLLLRSVQSVTVLLPEVSLVISIPGNPEAEPIISIQSLSKSKLPL
jgi:hypothetical protein